MSNQKPEDMLDEYPDLSDEDEVEPVNEQVAKEEKAMPNSQPHKLIKQNEGPSQPAQKQVFTAPLLFGGRNFIPPPPPPGSKAKMNMNFAPPPPSQANYSYPKTPTGNFQNNFKYNEQPPSRPERERKNCVYVKNIPKHYN
jgi:hypothetical protein